MKTVEVIKDKDGNQLLAKANCKKCYGRGYEGYSKNVKSGVVMCSCLKIKKILDNTITK